MPADLLGPAPRPPANRSSVSDQTRRWFAFRDWHRWFLALTALFLLIAGSHCWQVANYSRPLPFWDQWDGEWEMLLKPWLDGQLHFADLFAPHNEHRIFMTRVVNLALFASNGQWDGCVEMTFNVLLYAFTCTALAVVLARFFGTAYRTKILGAVALLGILPYGYENTLSGFMSQEYFLTLFSLTALWGLGFQRPGTWGWWAGGLSAALAQLSMGSGFFAAAALLVLLGLRWLRRGRRFERGEVAAASWCLIVVAVGWFTRVEVPGHEDLKAESIPAFIAALGRFAGWPNYGSAWMGIVTQAPLLLLAALSLRRLLAGGSSEHAPDGGRAVELLLTGSLWVALQIVALAYARGGHNALPSSRYTDLLALGTLANFLAVLLLVARPRRSAWGRCAVLGGACWLCFAGYQLTTLSDDDLVSLMPEWLRRTTVSEKKVRDYLASGDINTAFGDRTDLPFPDAEVLAGWLDDPELKAVLPRDVRRPLLLEAVVDPEKEPAFVPYGAYPDAGPAPDHLNAMGSYNGQGDAARGTSRWRASHVARGAYLHFYLSGYLGEPGLSFQVCEQYTGRPVVVKPEVLAREDWFGEYVRSPAPSLEIVASDQSEKTWFAFTEPVAVAWLSYWAGRLVESGAAIFTLGAALGWVLVVASWQKHPPGGGEAFPG